MKITRATTFRRRAIEWDEIQAENARLQEALERIEKCKGMTLLGGDPNDDNSPELRDLRTERAHQSGAAKAFDQCALIAEAALHPEQSDE